MDLLSPTVDIWRRALRHFVWNPLSRAAWCILGMKGSLFSHICLGICYVCFSCVWTTRGIDTDKVIIFRCLLKRYTSTSRTSTSLKLWLFGSQYQYQVFVYNMIFLQVSPIDDSMLSTRHVDNMTVAGCSLCTHSLPQSSLHNEGRKLEIFRFSWSGYIATDWMCLLIATPNDCIVNCYWLCICDFRDVNLLFTFYNFKYAFKMFNKNNHYNIDPVLFTASC